MHPAEAVAVLVAGVLAAPVADAFMLVAPSRQASVDIVLVGVDESAQRLGVRRFSAAPAVLGIQALPLTRGV